MLRPPFVDGGGRPVLAALFPQDSGTFERSVLFYGDIELNVGDTSQFPEALVFSEANASGTTWVVRSRLFLNFSFFLIALLVSLSLSTASCILLHFCYRPLELLLSSLRRKLTLRSIRTVMNLSIGLGLSHHTLPMVSTTKSAPPRPQETLLPRQCRTHVFQSNSVACVLGGTTVSIR